MTSTTFPPQLLALADYLSGEFDNREQALAEPVWYVHLRLWHRPVPLFQEDSFTIFAEQANVVNLERPYRQRIMRLSCGSHPDVPLKVQYYMFKDPTSVIAAGRNPALLNTLTPEHLELLPGCVLNVTQQLLAPNSYKFNATPPPDTRCCFSLGSNNIQVSLGFEVTDNRFLSYDKGIDSTTGKATWGAILGPYSYTKTEHYKN
ncbi:chromophore lyase CpcT/CpeT [Brasilonema sp. UFV-L1]|uniref:chromophore lyase CpcT/CpeT n=1 Tax=Brasilonema sp. UFV-L1 TaxID=2234130 RepID=UPI00145C86E4|nr:chromophore lyase CpcT/CpeT [Brasilonema sp. UFV-L1]NMG11332.1 chorismate mutase [Brasilonema sp. UFV-L1]